MTRTPAGSAAAHAAPTRTLRGILVVVAALGLAGCAAVAPWERGTLAKPQMAVDPFPMQSALRAHIYGSRQAGSVGGAAEGGGCGCY